MKDKKFLGQKIWENDGRKELNLKGEKKSHIVCSKLYTGHHIPTAHHT